MVKAASGATANYGLSQWARTDGICMDDFNNDNALIDAALAAGTKVETGSYTGTGTCGDGNPSSLTFDFVPKLVLIIGNAWCGFITQDYNKGLFIGIMQYLPNARATVTWSDSTLTWYAISYSSYNGYYANLSPEAQLNFSATTYHYIAIG